MIPAMVEAGYNKRYAMGLVAASGTLGILIPPSIPLIVYGIVTEQSIGKLFIAGIVPGIALTLVLAAYAIFYARRKGYGGTEKASWNERWRSLRKASWGIFLPILILVCIYSGATTPSEAAVISCVYSLIVSLFVYRETSLKDWHAILKDTIGVSAMIMFIIAGASVFSLYMTQEQIPQTIASILVSGEFLSKAVFFIATAILFLILGMFLESSSIMLITLPLLLPIMKLLNIDPYHFAIAMIINMEIAQITPPVGLNLFVISGIAKERLSEVFKGSAIFIVLMLLYLVIVILFPSLSLWLPNKMEF
ncbi:hypothetical protein GEPA3_3594 [Geobacillus sp. PA-3]|nr:hypothetical protein GEPA3_3594 [Geobacillus sp. PA-3]